MLLDNVEPPMLLDVALELEMFPLLETTRTLAGVAEFEKFHAPLLVVKLILEVAYEFAIVTAPEAFAEIVFVYNGPMYVLPPLTTITALFTLFPNVNAFVELRSELLLNTTPPIVLDVALEFERLPSPEIENTCVLFEVLEKFQDAFDVLNTMFPPDCAYR
jgi:hypothetical protein